MNFAVIQNGFVIALVGIFPSNWAQFQEVVPVPLNVQIGDEYIMGRFYRNSELVPTPEEILQQQMAEMTEALAIMGVTE